MKKLLLFLAVAVIFAACKPKQDNDQQEVVPSDSISTTTSSSSSIMIGVIDTDSIRENYAFFVQGLISINKKIADEESKIKAREAQLQKEAAEFQLKYENRAFLSQDRAEQEMRRIQKKGEELLKYQETVQEKLAKEHQVFFEQFQDSLNLAITELNKEKRFSVVLAKSILTNTVLYVEPNLNITKEVLDVLNQRYNK